MRPKSGLDKSDNAMISDGEGKSGTEYNSGMPDDIAR
jgi:hypothetical protein